MRLRLSLIAAVLSIAGLAAGPLAARADTSINGLVYADFSDKQNQDKATGAKSSDSGVGTDVKRFYFTVTHELDSVWSAQFQSDIGDQGAKRYDVFVKKAYVKARLDPLFSVLLGSASTSWIPFVDDLVGFRYVENSLIERLGFGTSADWGVHVVGQSGGKTINYDVAVENGKGYSNPSRTKSVDFEGRIGIQPLPGLNLAVGGYSGKRGFATYSTPALHNATRFDAMALYNTQHFHVGGEILEARNFNNVNTVATDKGHAYSVWGSIIPTPVFTIFARYDNAKPSTSLHPKLQGSFFDVGLQWRLNTAIAASLVYKHEEVKNGSITVPNGTIGSASSTHKGDYQEIGVWTVYGF